jgi:hypothetical protein
MTSGMVAFCRHKPLGFHQLGLRGLFHQPPLAAIFQRNRCVRGNVEGRLAGSEQPRVQEPETPAVDALSGKQNAERLRGDRHHPDELRVTASVPSCDGEWLHDRAVFGEDVEAGNGDGLFAADVRFDRVANTSTGLALNLE